MTIHPKFENPYEDCLVGSGNRKAFLPCGDGDGAKACLVSNFGDRAKIITLTLSCIALLQNLKNIVLFLLYNK